MTEYSVSLDNVFHALADPTRRAVIEQLSHGRASVSELAKHHNMALQSFSQHLKVLEDCGLVRTQKVGRVRTCEISENDLARAEHWISQQKKAWNDTFNRLDDYLCRIQTKEGNE
ncbi:transcriptional regulator [Pseudovibrio japonicus]|uniref:Transcriptional regulator n=1 Tax=Pseudovibrio japonicus TaxID=366534 RepID=A0ABQ3EBW7_9HYPH|nr:metalloregulator ArsR/SmtB family transcription factor [Pseudovibrio japonicus]GHB31497.1 transcriptional regulator [Pseudovibrio japonicus]